MESPSERRTDWRTRRTHVEESLCDKICRPTPQLKLKRFQRVLSRTPTHTRENPSCLISSTPAQPTSLSLDSTVALVALAPITNFFSISFICQQKRRDAKKNCDWCGRNYGGACDDRSKPIFQWQKNKNQKTKEQYPVQEFFEIILAFCSI